MKNINKKLAIGLLFLILLSPAGIFLPELFNAGDAWGEWSVETIEQLTGFIPAGMKKMAALWSAPIPDYTLNANNESMLRQSVYYILSAFVGVSLITLITFVIYKLMPKKE